MDPQFIRFYGLPVDKNCKWGLLTCDEGKIVTRFVIIVNFFFCQHFLSYRTR